MRPDKLTVGEAWKRYEGVTNQENKSWRADVGRAVHLLRHIGTVNASRLSQLHVDEYRTTRAREKTRRKTAPSVATVNREIALLKRFLNRSVRRGELRNNPIAHVRLLAEDNVRQRAVTEAEFEAMVLGADEWFRPILNVAYNTGMRRSEVLGLRWEQVDLREGIIRLAQSDTKSGKPRVIVLPGKVQDALQALPRPISGGYVFTNPRTGKPYNDIKKAFRRACAAAGLEGGCMVPRPTTQLRHQRP